MPETLFTEEVSFHDEASIVVTASRQRFEASVGGQSHIDEITLDVVTAVSVGIALTIAEARALSRALHEAAEAAES